MYLSFDCICPSFPALVVGKPYLGQFLVATCPQAQLRTVQTLEFGRCKRETTAADSEDLSEWSPTQ